MTTAELNKKWKGATEFLATLGTPTTDDGVTITFRPADDPTSDRPHLPTETITFNGVTEKDITG